MSIMPTATRWVTSLAPFGLKRPAGLLSAGSSDAPVHWAVWPAAKGLRVNISPGTGAALNALRSSRVGLGR
jgi:hypothetical protein